MQRASASRAVTSSKATPRCCRVRSTAHRPAKWRESSAPSSPTRSQDLKADGWHGPIRSGFGVHLVALSAAEPARDATLEEVREAVERDLLRARSEQANKAFYEKLRSGYVVRIGDASQ